MKHTRLFTLLLLVTSFAYGQGRTARKYAKTISDKDLKSYLSVLAADSLEGRETGQPGQKKAAAFISNKFEALGLEAPVETDEGPSYFQKFPLKKLSYVTAYLKREDKRKENFEDFLYYSRSETTGEEYVEFIYTGVQTVDQLVGKDLTGKYIAFISEEMDNWRTVLSAIKKLNAAGVLLIVENPSRYSFLLNRYRKSLSGDKLALEANNELSKILIGDPALAEWLFDKPYSDLKTSGEDSRARVIFNADMLVEEVYSENVLGFLEGTEKPQEVLIITSHYDHIGVEDDGRINNGADDDGSGTSVVMELAEAFAKAAENGIRPRRSILFMTVSGEEKGLLGSKYYVQHPIFPIENTVTNLNIDMVGRIDEKHEDNSDYIYLIGSDRLSMELHEVSEKVNTNTMKLELDYTYNAEDDPNRYYYRSDHYNFAEKGIPVIFYYNGTHADYHQPTDTVEKIEFELLEKRAKLIFYTAWELANRENRVKLIKK